jgi:prepilin-type N-terminal cleavage/methylation domain-containing protein
MSRRRSSRPFNAERGFTLIELLVGASIGTLIMGTVVNTLLSTTRYRREIETRLETQQGLNAAIDALTRDIRLAGACMPTVGEFVALEGENQNVGEPPRRRDTITARIGLVDAAGGCIRTTVRAAAKEGTTVLEVESAAGFTRAMRIYVAAPDGVGQFVTIDTVNSFGTEPSTDSLQLRDPLDRDYDAVSGVFAVQERAYQIVVDRLTGGVPMLELAVDDGEPRPMALGIDELDLNYTLRQNCPSCIIMPRPSSDAEWRLVNDVRVGLTARLQSPLTGRFYTVEEEIRVKPRNLLPPA